jgi:hypothetical protein
MAPGSNLEETKERIEADCVDFEEVEKTWRLCLAIERLVKLEMRRFDWLGFSAL